MQKNLWFVLKASLLRFEIFDRDTEKIPRLDYGYLLNKLTFSSFPTNYMTNK